MLDVFIKKIKNHEYISNLLYLKILENFPDMIPEGFDIDKYNGDVLDSNYIKFNDYFSNMYNKIDKNIKLDEEQIKAILAEEDYSLVIAGAGTGKTTTVSSLVKYLVDIKHVEPSKIAVMSCALIKSTALARISKWKLILWLLQNSEYRRRTILSTG